MTNALPSWWRPSSEAELQRAAADGLFEEMHHVEIKREPGRGDGASKESARDMASFGIDGGLLIYGVDEDTNPPSCSPFDPNGEPERLEAIARTRCQPPLTISCSVIESQTAPGKGFVVVTIPPSPTAPHMVDGRYYARGDKTRIVLSDAAVTELHRRRLQHERSIIADAADYLARSPLGQHPLGLGDMAVLARPTANTTPLLETLSHSDEWGRDTHLFVHDRADVVPNDGYAPKPSYATQVERRPHGVALTGHLQPGRMLSGDPKDDGRVVEIELDESGELRMLSARASEKRNDAVLIFDKLIVGNVGKIVRMAKRVGDRAGYRGGWEFAVHADNIAGGIAWAFADWFYGAPSVYTDAAYSRATSASYEELTTTPDAVTARLVLPLLRALNCDGMDEWQFLKARR